MRTIVIAVLLAACGAPTRGPGMPAGAPRSSAAHVDELPPTQSRLPARGRRVVLGEQQRVYAQAQQRRLAAQTIDIAESDLWSPCLREFVRAQDDVARRMLTLAFARVEVDCDKEGNIVLGPPHGYRGRTHLGYHATFAPGDTHAALTLAICDASRPSGGDVALAYDGHELAMPRLDFVRDRDGCYVTELPPSLTLERALPELFAADEVVVRFVDSLELEDLVVSHEMLRDMRLVFDAVDAVAAR